MSPRRPTHSRSWRDRAIEAGILGLLVLTPLAYGTVDPWSEAVAELLILAVATTWVLRMIHDWELRVELPPGWLPASLFIALVLLQAIPLPWGLTERLSPLSADAARAVAPYTGTTPAWVAPSLSAHATWHEALKLVGVAVFFLVVYNTCRHRSQLRRLLWTMIVTASVISILGIVQRATWNGRLYWIGPETDHPSVFGPFVNRADFGGFAVIVLPLALALILSRRPSDRRNLRDWRDRLRQWNSTEAGPTRLIVFLVLLLGGAALVSGSRAAVVSLLGALCCMLALSAGPGGATRSGTGRVAVVTGLVVLTGVWIGSDVLYGTIERLAQEVGRPHESIRARIWADALRLWAEAPLFGTGFATFAVVFPHVRTFAAPVAFAHAESDWVQLLTDTGLVGFALVGGAVATVAAALLARRRAAAGQLARTMALAGLVALAGSVVHGVGNFTLPVMSNLLYLAAAVAVALGAGTGSAPVAPPDTSEVG